jgi:hypothetical protein
MAMGVNGGGLNPGHIVTVTDCSPGTFRDIIAHLEVSTDFEYLVYRESELDALWSASGFALRDSPAGPGRRSLSVCTTCALWRTTWLQAGVPATLLKL